MNEYMSIGTYLINLISDMKMLGLRISTDILNELNKLVKQVRKLTQVMQFLNMAT